MGYSVTVHGTCYWNFEYIGYCITCYSSCICAQIMFTISQDCTISDIHLLFFITANIIYSPVFNHCPYAIFTRVFHHCAIFYIHPCFSLLKIFYIYPCFPSLQICFILRTLKFPDCKFTSSTRVFHLCKYDILVSNRTFRHCLTC